METKQIISWLYDKAARAMDHSYARMLNMTARRLRELDEKQRWIPVAERLPEESGEYIAYCGEYDGICVLYYEILETKGKWRSKLKEVTYWMPLPEPPKEERL